jgi:hypothetical protein
MKNENKLVVLSGKKNKEPEKPALDIITEHIEEIKQDKDRDQPQKALLITCFGDEDDIDIFQYVGANITVKDFLYISEKIKLQYLLDELG